MMGKRKILLTVLIFITLSLIAIWPQYLLFILIGTLSISSLIYLNKQTQKDIEKNLERGIRYTKEDIEAEKWIRTDFTKDTLTRIKKNLSLIVLVTGILLWIGIFFWANTLFGTEIALPLAFAGEVVFALFVLYSLLFLSEFSFLEKMTENFFPFRKGFRALLITGLLLIVISIPFSYPIAKWFTFLLASTSLTLLSLRIMDSETRFYYLFLMPFVSFFYFFDLSNLSNNFIQMGGKIPFFLLVYSVLFFSFLFILRFTREISKEEKEAMEKELRQMIREAKGEL